MQPVFTISPGSIGVGYRTALCHVLPMTADTFLSMHLAREWDYRAQAAITRLTKNAAFRYKAHLEQIDYATNRGLERKQMERLAKGVKTVWLFHHSIR